MVKKPKRLLVVEDEDAIRESLVLGLDDYGWEVTEAATSGSALEFDVPFDAYLLDLSLPDEDGLWLARQIEKRFGSVPVVLLTGYISPDLKEKAKECKIDAVVNKPFRFEELAKVLKNLCEPDLSN